MFERFTDRARRVVVLAQEEARDLGHNYIGTEHILLGLIRESEGVAARALQAMGISLDAVRRGVQEAVGQGEGQQAGHIPFTPRAKKVLELSLREALQLGHDYIGTEHILLGLAREGDGVAARVLVSLGAGLAAVRAQVIQLVPAAGAETVGRAETPGAPERPEELRQARMRAVVSRAQVEHLAGRVGEVLSRLDVIAERLARIETLLGEGRPASARAPRQPPGAGPGAAASQAGPEPGQPGSEPGQPGSEPGQPGSEPGQPGSEPGQPGTEPGPPGGETKPA